MKTSFNKQSLRGNTLLITLFVTAIIGIVLASYLTLVRNQNFMTMRSQGWNSAITVIEAGIEEALSHLDKNGRTSLLTDGWTYSGGLYSMTRWINDSYYVVTISSDLNPTIVSSGFVPLPTYASVNQNSVFAVAWVAPNETQYANRTVRVTTRRTGKLTKSMVARHKIDFNGNNVETDSFDSTDPAYSTNGQWDINKRRDHGDVASNDTIINTINFGNANIRGHVSTGPNGTIAIGPNGSVGDLSWVSSGTGGIKPGYFTDDMNVTFDPVLAPWSGGAASLNSGRVNGVDYDYVLTTDNYQSANLNMGSGKKMLVTGNAILYVTGDISMSGNASITIAPSGSLILYAAGSTALNGNGVINQGAYSTNFTYLGLPSNTAVSVTGNGTWKGVIYAPNAALNLKGSGSNPVDFIGASVSDTVTMNGKFNFHYDESLLGFQGGGKYIVLSWNEI